MKVFSLSDTDSLYVSGEEKFGFLASRMFNATLLSGTIRKFYNFVLKDIESRKFENILDIGSGTGTVLIMLLKKNPELKAHGIEPSRHMIRVAVKKASKNNLSNRLTFSPGSSRSIPGTGKYDLIISTMSFHHWKEREDSVKNIMSRLTSEGRFIVYEVADDGKFSRRMMKEHLLGRKTLEDISSAVGTSVSIIENDGFIRGEFRNIDSGKQ